MLRPSIPPLANGVLELIEAQKHQVNSRSGFIWLKAAQDAGTLIDHFVCCSLTFIAIPMRSCR